MAAQEDLQKRIVYLAGEAGKIKRSRLVGYAILGMVAVKLALYWPADGLVSWLLWLDALVVAAGITMLRSAQRQLQRKQQQIDQLIGQLRELEAAAT
ncbi:MAG: hypothetical protein GKR89_37170 [Candidatus Latescibacteria bacterium]|nr:hypothetical protein [Candidatus Latescibacterota bacterium]